MAYIDATEEDLNRLRDGLDVISRINHSLLGDFDIYLYGITSAPTVLDAARESIAYMSEEPIDEDDIVLEEIAVAIPVSSDILSSINGSGFKLHNEDFSYNGPENEGVRQTDFIGSTFKPKLILKYFSKYALADDVTHLNDFLERYGSKAEMRVNKSVSRNERATTPEPAPMPTPPTTPPAAAPKASSKQITALLDLLLG